MNALRETARQILHDQKEAMRQVVRDLNAEALNWKPVEEAPINSIAQLLSHALEAERFLIASSINTPVDRDREAQFQVTVERAEDLLTLIDRTERQVDAYLDHLTAEHLQLETTRGPAHRSRNRTGAWWLLHAIEHSNEHLGQAMLMRQLHETWRG